MIHNLKLSSIFYLGIALLLNLSVVLADGRGCVCEDVPVQQSAKTCPASAKDKAKKPAKRPLKSSKRQHRTAPKKPPVLAKAKAKPQPAPVEEPPIPVVNSVDPPREEGLLSMRAKQMATVLSVRLDGGTEPELVEIFGKVVSTVPGVVASKLINTRIVPNNSQASYVIWQVRIKDNSDLFRFQTAVTSTISKIYNAQGTITLYGVPYKYAATDISMLPAIRVGSTTSREIQFVVDSDLEQNRDFSVSHVPYNPPHASSTKVPFE